MILIGNHIAKLSPITSSHALLTVLQLGFKHGSPDQKKNGTVGLQLPLFRDGTLCLTQDNIAPVRLGYLSTSSILLDTRISQWTRREITSHHCTCASYIVSWIILHNGSQIDSWGPRVFLMFTLDIESQTTVSYLQPSPFWTFLSFL